MHIQIGVAKVGKYATSESGDTLEMVERPHGGLSFVLVDGQRSGKGAKAISNLVAHKTVTLLAEGVRDGAAARAAHDYLYAVRAGKVSATLNIASVDMETKTLVISRNSHCPVVIQSSPEIQLLLDRNIDPVGVHRMTKPEITELPLKPGKVVVVYTDGLMGAGERKGRPMNVPESVKRLYLEHHDQSHAARSIADGLLAEALELDDGRPNDDTSILVLSIHPEEIGEVRRMEVLLPVPPILRPDL
jgi:serine phosphatase RsbU (regulator of sigma subunit)